MTTNLNFPVFFANQVLRHDHLNELVEYLEEQTRLTRSKTIGVGVVCGFNYKWDRNSDNLGQAWDTLSVSKGVGITSEGFLIAQDAVSFSHYRKYTRDQELSQLEQDMASDEEYTRHIDKYRELSDVYPFFRNSSGNDLLDLYELVSITEDKEDTTALTTAFLEDKVLIVYLNCDLQSLKQCDANNCDDKGAELQFDVRYLIAPASVAVDIVEEESRRLNGQKHIYLHDTIVQSRLGKIALTKLNFNDSLPIKYTDLLAQYKTRVSAALKNIATGIGRTFQVYSYILEELYSEAQKNEILNKINEVLEKLETLKGTNAYQIQYYYNYCQTIIEAYDEFIALSCQLESTCASPDNIFPKHLLLGQLNDLENNLMVDREYLSRNSFVSTGDGYFPIADEKIKFRHKFISSPKLNNQKYLIEKIKTAHLKIYELVVRFDPALIVNKPIKVVPSNASHYMSSEKMGIPGYYNISTTEDDPDHKLLQLWSYNKTRKSGLGGIYSYHTLSGMHPLSLLNNNSDYYRIEGQIGKDVSQAVNEILGLRQALGLDFKLQVVKMSDTNDIKYINSQRVELFRDFASDHPGLESINGVLKGGTFVLAYEELTSRPRVFTFQDKYGLNQSYINSMMAVRNEPLKLEKAQSFIEELNKKSSKPDVYNREIKDEYERLKKDANYRELRDTAFEAVLEQELEKEPVSASVSIKIW